MLDRAVECGERRCSDSVACCECSNWPNRSGEFECMECRGRAHSSSSRSSLRILLTTVINSMRSVRLRSLRMVVLHPRALGGVPHPTALPLHICLRHPRAAAVRRPVTRRHTRWSALIRSCFPRYDLSRSDTPRSRFDTFYWSCVTVFQVYGRVRCARTHDKSACTFACFAPSSSRWMIGRL